MVERLSALEASRRAMRRPYVRVARGLTLGVSLTADQQRLFDWVGSAYGPGVSWRGGASSQISAAGHVPNEPAAPDARAPASSRSRSSRLVVRHGRRHEPSAPGARWGIEAVVSECGTSGDLNCRLTTR